jgi:hypothetical protein
LCFDPHGDGEIEYRPFARLGFDPDPPAVHFNNALSDRQAKTSSSLLAGDRAIGLLELLENLGLIGWGYTGSGVAHRNRERSVHRRGSDRDLALIGELDRVADKVEQDLGKPPSIPAAPRQVRCDLGLEG